MKTFEENSPATQNGSASFILAKRLNKFIIKQIKKSVIFADQIENSVENRVDQQIQIDSNPNDKDLTKDLIKRIQNSSFEESFDFKNET
ncbi:hypothetical protein BpHYR1_019696 [Brachionus plicatilis]|uniref:Uncharacterized protein n=1 Tax=Brachionus plicatilis TaxID=10195 RepID=A0A3M7PHS7_BRAPC|nr:hypothetical protein BpHYR1_019696 [Brachionus plicatilis]